MSYWYNWFSWWWAHGCSKHVEYRNKHIRKIIVRQVGYLQELCRDARSAKRKIDLNNFSVCQKTEALCVYNSRKTQDGIERIQYFWHQSVVFPFPRIFLLACHVVSAFFLLTASLVSVRLGLGFKILGFRGNNWGLMSCKMWRRLVSFWLPSLVTAGLHSLILFLVTNAGNCRTARPYAVSVYQRWQLPDCPALCYFRLPKLATAGLLELMSRRISD